MKRKHVPQVVTTVAKKLAYRFYHFSEKVFQPPFDRYDFETFDVINRVVKRDSNCIDIGAHKGEILNALIKKAPAGRHIAFEPIPYLFQRLKKKYKDRVQLFNTALSSEVGEATFTVFKDRPAVSGLKERNFDNAAYNKEQIIVKVERLEDLVPAGQPVHLIKIDVEGAELEVLKGAKRILEQYHPVVLFEFGKGGSDLYGATPELMYDFFDALGYTLTLQQYFLKNQPGFSRAEFIGQFEKGYNYFFLAHKADKPVLTS
ncbi:FkbM family methyltransferase [Niabella beijingensis]|uniref:FkbM family methyltransferase n=1 Tax=Niabella beijingensis TaxID=2872700 RepID=UPI001CBE798C|nr:FkbM family methyltransferase [Niabella beijingensis]MBZ4187767.1 FkbM family methyltransferase [Niabella beijingensis]